MVATFARATAPSTPPEPRAAVDDLIKFRLLESLLRRPDAFVSAADLAQKLGFHSIDVTASELDELVSAGLLRARRDGDELSYALVVDERTRAELTDLVAQGPPSLLTRLAAGSVSRIKNALARRKRP